MKIVSTVVAAKNKIALGAGLMLASAATFAADGDTSSAANFATDAMNTLKTSATDMISQTWPIITTVVVAGLTMRLFKKFSSKAV